MSLVVSLAFNGRVISPALDVQHPDSSSVILSPPSHMPREVAPSPPQMTRVWLGLTEQMLPLKNDSESCQDFIILCAIIHEVSFVQRRVLFLCF